MNSFRTLAVALALSFGAVAAMPIVAAEAAPKAQQKKKAAKPAQTQTPPQTAAQPNLPGAGMGNSNY